LVGELVEFHVERRPDPSKEAANPPEPLTPKPLPHLPPLAAALSVEGHLLSTLPVDARPPDMLGMASIVRLMSLARDPAGAERATAA